MRRTLAASFILLVSLLGLTALAQQGPPPIGSAGGATYTGSAPIVVSGTAISCPTCGTGTGTVSSVGFTGGLISVATPTSTPAFTVAGTSGGIPYFDSASTWNTSGALTANSLILGGGAGAAPKIAAGFTTDGSKQLSVGAQGVGNGILALVGTTSGSATCTAPSVAGTTSNAVTCSNATQFGGTVSVSTGGIQSDATHPFIWSGRSQMNSTADGIITFGTNANAAMTRFLLGPDTTSNVALCPNGTGLKIGQGGATCTTLSNLQAGSYTLTALVSSNTAPTIAGAGCGGSAAAISGTPNGTASFNVNVGTAPTSGGCTITMPAASTTWNCYVNDQTTTSTSVFYQKQTGANSTTSVVVQNFSDVAVATAPSASDIYHFACSAN